jgi:hypothetical protein
MYKNKISIYLPNDISYSLNNLQNLGSYMVKFMTNTFGHCYQTESSFTYKIRDQYNDRKMVIIFSWCSDEDLTNHQEGVLLQAKIIKELCGVDSLPVEINNELWYV